MKISYTRHSHSNEFDVSALDLHYFVNDKLYSGGIIAGNIPLVGLDFMRKYIVRILLLGLIGLVAVPASAQYPMEYRVSAGFVGGNGDFAPYYLASNRHGLLTQSLQGYVRAGLFRPMDTDKMFSYGFGADLVGGYSSSVDIDRYRYDAALGGEWGYTSYRPSAFRVQQLYAEIKYWKLYLTVGVKEYDSFITNRELSSGNLLWSGNARPIPGARIGFLDFWAIPGTKGWLRILIDIMYGKFTDDDYTRSHYNYYNSNIALHSWYHYKRFFFSTKKDEPFVFTIGMEHAAQFGGTYNPYAGGFFDEIQQQRIYKSSQNPKLAFVDFVQALVPVENAFGRIYYAGNHVGAWGVSGVYTFKNKARLKAYVQFPFEDGSGIGKLNGFDGLYGLEYDSGRKNWLSGAVVEYLDMTNQSGPIHYSPENDHPGSPVTGHVSGADDYYNNYFYNGWAHYGMGMGSPMLKSPLYNKDGYPKYLHTRVRGGHIGVTGYIAGDWKYRMLTSYRVSWGTPFIPLTSTQDDWSFLAECVYTPAKLSGWTFSAAFSCDVGSLYGNQYGAMVTVGKSGSLFNRKK